VKKRRDALADECEQICTCVYTCIHTCLRSGGNGSVRVCFAPEQIVADMQMRGTFYSYFQIVIKDA